FFGPHRSTEPLPDTPAQHDQPSLYYQFPYRSQSSTQRGQCNPDDTAPMTSAAPTTSPPIYLAVDATQLRRLAQSLFVPAGHAALVPVVPRWYTTSQPQLLQNAMPVIAHHMALPGASTIHRSHLAQLAGPTQSSADVTHSTKETCPCPEAKVRLLEVQLQFEELNSSLMEDASGIPVVTSSHCNSRASYSSSPSPTLPPHDNLDSIISGPSTCSCCGLGAPTDCSCGSATCLVPYDHNQCFHFRETIRLRRQIDSLRRCVALLQEDLMVERRSKQQLISCHSQVVTKLDAEIADLHNQINDAEPAVSSSLSLNTSKRSGPVGSSEGDREELKETASLEQANPPYFNRLSSVLLKNPLCFDPFEGVGDSENQPWYSDDDGDDDDDSDSDMDEDNESEDEDESDEDESVDESDEDDESVDSEYTEDDSEMSDCSIVVNFKSDEASPAFDSETSSGYFDLAELGREPRSPRVQFSRLIEHIPTPMVKRAEIDTLEFEDSTDSQNREGITMHQLLAERLARAEGEKDGTDAQLSDEDTDDESNDNAPLDLIFSENDKRFSLPMPERLDILRRTLRSHLAQARVAHLQPAMIIAHTDLLVQKFGLVPAQALELILALYMSTVESTLEQQLFDVGNGDDSIITPLDRLETFVQRTLADFETAWLPLVEYYMVNDRLDQVVVINSLADYLAHLPDDEKASSSTVTLGGLTIALSRPFLVYILTVLCLYHFSLLDSDILYDGQSVFMTTNDESPLSLHPRTPHCSSTQWVWQAFVQYLVCQPFFSQAPKKDPNEGSSVPLASSASDSKDSELRHPCSAAGVSNRFVAFLQGLSLISGQAGETQCSKNSLA
ncbi:hypothetical protein IWQ62_004204, partial [Dispira parvispora]